MRSRALVCLGASTLSACTLLIDTGGLGGEDSNAAIDGSPDRDAPSTPSTDGGDAGVASPCSLTHTFCDDFDQGVLQGRWSKMLTSGGALDLDTSEFVSGPRSLRVRLRPGTGTREAALHRDFTTTKMELEVSADLKVDRGNGDFTELDFFTVFVEPPPPSALSHGVTLLERPDGFKFQYFVETSPSQYAFENIPVTFTAGKWQHITMRLSFAASPPVALFSVERALVATVPISKVTPAGGSLQVGAPFVFESDSTKGVRVDNVTFDDR